MNFAFNIVIGNVISLIAGIFIILSMWVNDEKDAYRYQFLNAFILMISSVEFFTQTTNLRKTLYMVSKKVLEKNKKNKKN